MSIIVKVLVPPRQITNVQTTQYTAVNCRAIIDKFTATNTSTNIVGVSVNLVNGGDPSGMPNLMVNNRMIAPGETYTFPELVGHVVDMNGFISTIATTANALTVRVSGREIV